MASSLALDRNEEDVDETEVKWINVIFIPFHQSLKFLVLIAVIVKCIVGPLSAVYTFIKCSDIIDYPAASYVKYVYSYFCDPIYITDTFLHIVHRQVREEAVRREHLPKSAFLILLDIISVIPIMNFVAEKHICVTPSFWPNILAFNEIVIIYRIVDHFNLIYTHSIANLLIGYVILFVLILNSLTCAFLLMTFSKGGLCERCNIGEGVYDWRAFIHRRFNNTSDVHTYTYSATLMISLLMHRLIDEIRPRTITEFKIAIFTMIAGYLCFTMIIMPKFFAEGLLRTRRITSFDHRVKRIIEETERRNPVMKAHKDVEKFYALMWEKRKGITSIPDIMNELPIYLRIDIKIDLVWPVFHHSPTFRRTSSSYKRWLCEYIRLEYKLPGERFFAGSHCYTNLYYIKSGIVQIFSIDDSLSALISVTSGTLFGDVSFVIPPLHRKVTVRCLTYCEVFVISRAAILNSLHRFPEDRRNIMASVRERIKHARTLYACKQQVRGYDRTEDEGIAWIKRRWWDISATIANYKKTKKEKQCQLPPEENYYHCAKYIGQLVLCSEGQLQKKSMFLKVTFPWVLAPYTTFGYVWEKIVYVVVWIVVLTYPPNIVKLVLKENITWFPYLQYSVNLVFLVDIFVSLMTAEKQEGYMIRSSHEVVFFRFKSPFFILDLLATSWIGYFCRMIGIPKYFYPAQFNRLLKVYMLYFDRYKNTWTRNNDPLNRVLYMITLTHFLFFYVFGFFLYMCSLLVPGLTVEYFFGEVCTYVNGVVQHCKSASLGVLSLAMDHTFESIFPSHSGKTMIDTVIRLCILFLTYSIDVFTKAAVLPVLYLRYREIVNYQYFVYNLKNYYARHQIHPELMKRLDRYLVCQWKNYKGMDIVRPTTLKDEPYDIYWKLQGEISEKIISESGCFRGTDPRIIRELANKAKFLILPKNSTILLFGVELTLVAWLVKGVIKSEYENDAGEVVTHFIKPGGLISVTSVFIGKMPLRSYVTATDCEILYIRKQDFYNTLKRYPTEYSDFEICEKELMPKFMEIYNNINEKHKQFHKTQRQAIFHRKHSRLSIVKPSGLFSKIKAMFNEYRTNPESKFIQTWMRFRVLVVFLSIINAAAKGGSGALVKRHLEMVTLFCDTIGVIDICIKLFLPYYNKDGLVVSSKKKCMVHYMSRGFTLDIIGCFPMHRVMTYLILNYATQDILNLSQTLCKSVHSYIILGYFNYEADQPTVNAAYLTILKWQLCIVMIMYCASHYYMTKCVSFTWDSDYNLNMTKEDQCWMPRFLKVDSNPTAEQLHLLYAKSLSLAQLSFLRNQNGKWQLVGDRITLVFGFLILGFIFWYFMCYCQTLFVLSFRGNTLFHHGVKQLRDFLTSERVDKEVTNRVVAHFTYWWLRTKGINVQNLMTERIGLIFRQDLSYYFFESTLQAANTLLLGNKNLERHLASHMHQLYFLPGEDIMREMHLTPNIFLVHRGKVQISKDGQKVVLLSKGCIFGQLRGSVVRPIRVTATASGHADVLCLSVKQFHDVIDKEIQKNINNNPQSENDYMQLTEEFPEKATDDIPYILRGRKIVKLPRMYEPVHMEKSNLYWGWLFSTLFGGPICTFVIVLMLGVVDETTRDVLLIILLLFDLLHLAHIVIDFFTMEIKIIDNKCVHRYNRLKKILSLAFFLDMVSFLFVIMAYGTGVWQFHLGRLLRVYCMVEFYQHVCHDFKTRLAVNVIKISLMVLLLHTLTCGWIYIACKNDFQVSNPVIPELYLRDIDRSVWKDPHERKGCRCTTSSIITANGTREIAFFVPTNWQDDYVIAFLYMIIIFTSTNMDHVIATTIQEVYYRIFVTIVLYLLDLWFCSITISTVYTKFRELYVFDFQVSNLVNYLRLNGLSAALVHAVVKYTKQLWNRQKGCWLPEITFQAPTCLREDIMDALYIHHLQTVPLFQDLPNYFLRQLTTRLTRIVIYPGKYIVREGDIFPTIYFIHEGEVEKWYTDLRGEQRLSSVLSINGYFGLIPGLYPNVPYKYTYYSRTVVDLVTLKYSNWQDLLAGYPEVKVLLYTEAKQYKKNLGP